MITSLIYHERIKTTTPKAKELRKFMERTITYAKKHVNTGDHHYLVFLFLLTFLSLFSVLNLQTLARAVVRDSPSFVKLVNILGPRYINRPGGYTRILKLQNKRKGDSADVCIIELVDREGEARKPRNVNFSGFHPSRNELEEHKQG